jgi:hypothetical protein
MTHAVPMTRTGLFLLLLLTLVSACVPLAPDGEELRFRSGGDLVAAGPVVEVPESVEGDVMAAGRDVLFTGDARGSVLIAGATQTLEGSVAGNVHAAGGAVLLASSVERNVTLLAADLLIAPDADVALNAYLVGGRVEQRGAVRGNLRVAAREVVLDGPVGGNVDVIAGRLTLGPSARIDGDLTYRVRQGADSVDPAAVVSGDVQAVHVPGPSTAFRLSVAAGRVAAFLLAGFVVLLLARPLAGAAERLNERPGAALGLGLLWIIAIPLMVFAIAVTIVGIPLAVIATACYLISLYLAPVIPALWLGVSLLDRPGETPTAAPRAFLMGGAIVAVLSLLPWIGVPVRVLVTALGFGAVALHVRAGLSEPEAIPR